jgi:hypothetical protein
MHPVAALGGGGRRAGESHDRAALVVPAGHQVIPWRSIAPPATTPKKLPIAATSSVRLPSRREIGEDMALRFRGETRST